MAKEKRGKKKKKEFEVSIVKLSQNDYIYKSIK